MNLNFLPEMNNSFDCKKINTFQKTVYNYSFPFCKKCKTFVKKYLLTIYSLLKKATIFLLDLMFLTNLLCLFDFELFGLFYYIKTHFHL